MQGNTYEEEETRSELMAGVNIAANLVKGTLSGVGYNVILEESVYPGHRVTNDGISILRKIQLPNRLQQVGVNLLKEASEKANLESGDGTTTAAVLTQAILNEGIKIEDVSPMEIKKSLDECLPIINAALESQKKDITIDDIRPIALISSESEELADIFQKIYSEIGTEGIVELDTSTLPETTYEITDGVRLRGAGFTYPYMVNDEKGRAAVYENPKILITKQKIGSTMEADALMKKFHEAGLQSIVIFCDEIDLGASQHFAKAHMEGIFKALIIKAPTLWKDWLFEDFAKITGATIIDRINGLNLKNFHPSHLGTCAKITTTKEETRIVGIQDISKHIESLKENTDDSKLRISWLQTKAAILKLGANTETELSHLKDKAEDARHACFLALNGGIVPGGGVALLNAAKELRNNKKLLALHIEPGTGKEQKPTLTGVSILYAALQAPFRQICENAGVNVQHNLSDKDLKTGKGESIDINLLKEGRGLNAKSKEIVDMFDAGIVDSLVVTKNCIKNAISVAGTVLTVKAAVTTPPQS